MTVTNSNGSASDQTSVLVSQKTLETSIGITGGSAELLLGESLTMRSTVYSLTPYEIEWMVDEERVSTDYDYTFTAEHAGEFVIGFKALTKSGDHYTDKLTVTVSVPLLSVSIISPKYGFSIPTAFDITLGTETKKCGLAQFTCGLLGSIFHTSETTENAWHNNFPYFIS